MKVFVTGATGWIGSAVVGELAAAGHEPIGLVRSDAGEESLTAKGVKALRGDLDDLDSLRRGAADSDAVVHLANKHDWGNPAESDRAERAAVETLIDTLAGTGRALMVANALSGLGLDRPAVETDASPEVGPTSDRGGSENLTLAAAEQGVRSSIIRFAPSVHGVGDWGFVSFLAAAARERGVSGYIEDGSNTWSAVHRSDAARLIRLGLESAPAGTRLHAVGEPPIATRAIAEALGAALGLPVVSVPAGQAEAHFGMVGEFFANTMTASSELTRTLLGWSPSGPTLIDDIRSGAYSLK